MVTKGVTMANYLQLVQVSDECAKKLPLNGAIIGKKQVLDLDRVEHEAYVIRWYDTQIYQYRTAYFDVSTGEYIGDSFSEEY